MLQVGLQSMIVVIPGTRVRQFYNKVHTSVTNLAKIQSGYFWISLLFLEATAPDAVNPEKSLHF